MRRSIRVRLIVWVLALLVPLSVAAAWLLIQVFGNRLLHDVDVSLEEEAETVAELLATPASATSLDGLLAHIAGETEQGPHKYITVAQAGRIIAAVPAGAAAVLRAGGPQLRVVRYTSPGGRTVVTIGVSAAAALHAQQRLTSLLAVATPLLLLLLGAGLWWLVGRALRPLANASRQLESIAADNLALRVPAENTDDEVGRMVAVLNRMLDRLQQAVVELQRFTADAAHELRTPLTVLRTGLEVALARERPAAEYRAALDEALAATRRMGRLAEDLLTLARLEAAGAPRTAAVVDLGEMLHELADAAQEAAAARRLAVTVEAGAGLWVRGNAGDLYRLLNNLIDNAVTHGADGGAGSAAGRIVLSAQRQTAQIAVTVADTGPGIPPEDLRRVFDRFYRGSSERHDATGTGLGLSIAQEIARTHGGYISAANRDGGGCAITVTLPAAAAPPLPGH